MKLAVLQSNYLPWKGYFDIIHDVDLFLFYDEVQYTKNDWRNRNRILTRDGLKWLTVPVFGSIEKRIDEIEIVENRWQRQHYQAILTNYSKSPYFQTIKGLLEDTYLDAQWQNLSQLNQSLIIRISRELLGIQTEFGISSDYQSSGSGHQKLLSLVKATGAEVYISGPAAKNYIDLADYTAAGIELIWKDYSGYPAYPQQFSPFEHQVSIIDLICNTGPDAPQYIWGWRDNPKAD
jgi:hypothetical protein